MCYLSRTKINRWPRWIRGKVAPVTALTWPKAFVAATKITNCFILVFWTSEVWTDFLNLFAIYFVANEQNKQKIAMFKVMLTKWMHLNSKSWQVELRKSVCGVGLTNRLDSSPANIIERWQISGKWMPKLRLATNIKKIYISQKSRKAQCTFRIYSYHSSLCVVHHSTMLGPKCIGDNLMQQCNISISAFCTISLIVPLDVAEKLAKLYTFILPTISQIIQRCSLISLPLDVVAQTKLGHNKVKYDCVC